MFAAAGRVTPLMSLSNSETQASTTGGTLPARPWVVAGALPALRPSGSATLPVLESRRMATVTVLPAGIEFEAKSGETMMAAALAGGLYWPTTCGGQGLCTTCLAEVVSGGDHLLEMGRTERKTIAAERGESALRGPFRLACQAIVMSGPVVVEKAGVRPAGAD